MLLLLLIVKSWSHSTSLPLTPQLVTEMLKWKNLLIGNTLLALAIVVVVVVVATRSHTRRSHSWPKVNGLSLYEKSLPLNAPKHFRPPATFLYSIETPHAMCDKVECKVRNYNKIKWRTGLSYMCVASMLSIQPNQWHNRHPYTHWQKVLSWICKVEVTIRIVLLSVVFIK